MTTRRAILVSGMAAVAMTALPGMTSAKALKAFNKRVLDALAIGAHTGGMSYIQSGLDEDVARFLLDENLAYSLNIRHYRQTDTDKSYEVSGLNADGFRAGNVVLADRLSPEAGAFLRKAFADYDPDRAWANRYNASVQAVDEHLKKPTHRSPQPSAGMSPKLPTFDWMIERLTDGSIRPEAWNPWSDGVGYLTVEPTRAYLGRRLFPVPSDTHAKIARSGRDVEAYKNLSALERMDVARSLRIPWAAA